MALKEEPKMGVVRFPPGDGISSPRVFGELVTRKVTGEQTGGAYTLFEVATRPGGGPPPHVQRWEDEAVYVLEEEHDFFSEGGNMGVGPRSLVYVPRGRLHAYTNVGDRPGRLLVVHTPGSLHESFVEETGEDEEPSGPWPPGASPDFASVAGVATRYGIEIPPLEGNRQGKEPR